MDIDSNKFKDIPYLLISGEKVLAVSSSFLEMTGYENENILEKSLSEVFIQLLKASINIYDLENLKETVECFLFIKSLEAREVMISLSKDSNTNNKMYIVEEKPNSRLEDKLIFAEQLFKDNILCCSIYSVPDLILLKANQKYLNYMDSPYNLKENCIGTTLRESVAGFEGSNVEKNFFNIIKTGKPIYYNNLKFDYYEIGITYWDGSVIPIFIDGNLKFIFQIASDETETVLNEKRLEKQSEIILKQKERLKQQNELLRRQANLLNLSDEAIFAWDLFGTIIYWNKGAEKLYGYSSEEAFGCFSQELLKTVYPFEIENIKAILARDGFWDGDIVHTSKDGEKLIIETRKQVILDESGQPIVLETNRDVTERNQQQERLIQIEKQKNEAMGKVIEMKDEFLMTMSHEFKTPLAVINAAIQAMELICKNELSDKAKGFLSQIRRNSNRQLKLINNLLDITRLNEGHVKIHNEKKDIVSLSKSITESITVFAEQKNIKLSFSSTLKKKVIVIDEEKYERILLNLLSNAVKFTPEGKLINVNVFQKIANGENKVCVQVIDNGIGIPLDKQQLIFDRFGQVDSSLTRQVEGTGIGLCLVKMLVETQGGEINLKSKEGEGSTFTILLPTGKVKEIPAEIKIPTEISDNRLIQATAIEFSDIYLK